MTDPSRRVEAEIEAEEPYNAADAKAVNNARKKAARRERARLDVVAAMMKHPETRFYLHEIMESCNVFGNPVVMGDTHATYYELGRQNVGKKILMDVIQFKDEYYLMMEEGRQAK